MVEHGNTLPEGQAHAGIDDEILPSEYNAVKLILFHALGVRILEVRVILGHYPWFKAEGLKGPDPSEDVLGIATSLGVDLQDVDLNHGIKATGRTEHNEQRGHHEDEDQGQLSLGDKRDRECRHKGGEDLDGDAGFFCYARLNKVAVCGCLLRDGAGGAPVVVGDLLVEGSL